MPKLTNNHGRLDELAASLAAGIPVKTWAERNGVPLRTAYKWAAKPEVKELVRVHAREVADQIKGITTNNAALAGRRLQMLLADKSTPQSILVRAIRIGLIALPHISAWSDDAGRLSDLEERMNELSARNQKANRRT
jgi:hypothetical protein